VMDKNRAVFIDLAKTIGILAVILFHVAYEISLNNELRPIGFIGVSLFFIASGFVLAKKYAGLEFFSFKWIYRRYLKIALIYYPALIAIAVLLGNQTYTGSIIKNLIVHFSFLDAYFSDVQYSIISPAWFFAPLMGLYLLFPYLN